MDDANVEYKTMGELLKEKNRVKKMGVNLICKAVVILSINNTAYLITLLKLKESKEILTMVTMVYALFTLLGGIKLWKGLFRYVYPYEYISKNK